MGGILGDNLGEGNCESKIASRQWGDNFCRETSICLAGPSGYPGNQAHKWSGEGAILTCLDRASNFVLLRSKTKTNKQKTHKRFSNGPCGTIVPGTNPHLSQGQTGQTSDFTVELNRERPVCPRDGSHFVPGRGPICPRDGSCLSRRPSRRKYLCLFILAVTSIGGHKNGQKNRGPGIARNSATRSKKRVESQ